MKKPNIIIGKKQIILASLTLILGVAIYVNYVLSQGPGELVPTSVYEGTGVNYGDVAFVSGTSTSDYFAQARIDRMNARDAAVETLQTILNGGDIAPEEKAVLSEKAIALSKLVETESKVETLIKAAGFEDCVVYLDGESANIVVKCKDGLIPSQAAQIKDILLNEITVENEKIRILDV